MVCVRLGVHEVVQGVPWLLLVEAAQGLEASWLSAWQRLLLLACLRSFEASQGLWAWQCQEAEALGELLVVLWVLSVAEVQVQALR